MHSGYGWKLVRLGLANELLLFRMFGWIFGWVSCDILYWPYIGHLGIYVLKFLNMFSAQIFEKIHTDIGIYVYIERHMYEHEIYTHISYHMYIMYTYIYIPRNSKRTEFQPEEEKQTFRVSG